MNFNKNNIKFKTMRLYENNWKKKVKKLQLKKKKEEEGR